MRKRERENPCGICGHYHKYEEGEVCGVCGHRMAAVADKSAAPSVHVSAFSTEILPEFLYLGSYDNAARAELLKTQSISRVLNFYSEVASIPGPLYVIGSMLTSDIRTITVHVNIGSQYTVPACQNLYKNSFTYHCLPEEKRLPFDDAIQFLEQCEREGARVLVHCMSGKNRSPAIVIAYLMKSKGWRLAQSYQWVKERRPSVEINSEVYEQLQEFEQKIFGSTENSVALPIFPSSNQPSLSFGFSRTNETPTPAPAFNNTTGASVFSHRPPFEIPQEFAFGAGQPQASTQNDSPFSASTNPASVNDITMGGS